MPSTYQITEGAGAAVVFGTSGVTLQIESITPPAASRAGVPGTHLGSTVATESPGVLVTYGNMTIEAQWSPSIPSLVSKTPETISLQYPPSPGQTKGKVVSYPNSWVLSETPSAFTHGSPIKMTYEIKINSAPVEIAGY